jgi:ubiquitin C-terminal hydrolase
VDLNPGSDSKGALASDFSQLMQRLWTQGEGSVTEPSCLKKRLGKLNESFAGFAQQDSQELLRFLLDGLHEDLNRIRVKPAWFELEDIAVRLCCNCQG